jgi:NTE family protein
MVLSSGGPLGISHLGVLKKLEEEKIKPDIITGSSAGAIAGGLYASGTSIDEMIDLALSNELSKMFSDYTILGIYSNGFGAIRGSNMLNLLREKTKNKLFYDLKIPFAANAVNFFTSKEIMLKKGNIAEALRASASIPMLFKPYYLNGKYLIDGSVSNPLPVNLARKLGADYTLGITFSSNSMSKVDPSTMNFVDQIKALAISKLDDSVFGKLKRIMNIPMVNKIMNLFSIDKKMLYHFFKMHNAGLKVNKSRNMKSDILIDTQITNKNISKEELIKTGYNQAAKMIEDVKIAIENAKINHSKLIR